MPQPSGLLSVPSGDPGQGHGVTRGGEHTPEARPVWGLGHTCPALRGSWHPCPAGRPRSFGGGGTHPPLYGGRGTRAPYEIREPDQETAAHPEEPLRCHIHGVDRRPSVWRDDSSGARVHSVPCLAGIRARRSAAPGSLGVTRSGFARPLGVRSASRALAVIRRGCGTARLRSRRRGLGGAGSAGAGQCRGLRPRAGRPRRRRPRGLGTRRSPAGRGPGGMGYLARAGW